MEGIDPKNISAQSVYRGVGNPPNTHPSSAISNSFPGLEMDIRNIWRHILIGLEMHESDNYVVRVEADADEALKNLQGYRLIAVDGQPIVAPVTGPRPLSDSPPFPQTSGPDMTFTYNASLEWSNALAMVLTHSGQRIRCLFLTPDGQDQETLEVEVQIRSVFAQDASGVSLAVIERILAGPGDLTRSLCSPWQNDYRECACYYWAASRPDYVNVEKADEETSRGHNWLQRQRGPTTPKQYIIEQRRTLHSDLLSYDELFQKWEQELRFVIGGNDTE